MRPALWAFKIVLWLVAILMVLILMVMPVATSMLTDNTELDPRTLQKFLKSAEFAQAWAMRFFVVGWCFFLGSCFASFLNVVAWRVPRGRSILGSSHCPNCDSKLSFFRDNIPVIGWIKNEGRCRSCAQSISPRYLIVEVILGLVFLTLILVTMWGGGVTLPLRVRYPILGFERSLFEPKWELLQLVGYQLVLSCFLFTFGLIRSERLSIPFSILFVGLLAGIGLPLVWPAMHLANHLPNQTEAAELTRFSVEHFLTLGVGLVVGGLMGGIVDRFCQRRNSDVIETEIGKNSAAGIRPEMLFGLMLVGLYLGFQSVLSVTIIWGVVTLLAVAVRFRGAVMNHSGTLFFSMLIHLLTWRLGSQIGYWPSPTSSTTQIGVAIAVIMILLAMIRWVKSSSSMAEWPNEVSVDGGTGSESVHEESAGVGSGNGVAGNEDSGIDETGEASTNEEPAANSEIDPEPPGV